TIAVNLTGTFLCTGAVLPDMLDRRWGRVVNIASTAGLRGYKTMTAYSASKHGVVGFTRSLALETAKHGVTVNAVCPGYTDTDMSDRAITNLVQALGVSPEEAKAMLVRGIPRGRLTTPAEVASAVAWRCSPDAAAVTGIAMPIAGGEVG
ncbi:MAG TPA: SDR family NAD(P)-dependent oxidoreductase, partial [Gemmatimonadaceae bacterium]|nr:SDR family NAD(P)-dependent oxidoreductase [Gemmatimonadaceae bacterium]